MQKFSRDDLKLGYLVELRNRRLRMVMPVDDGSIMLVDMSRDRCFFLSNWDDELNSMITREYDIMKVYGYIDLDHCDICRYINNADHRPLLWERCNAKKMTVAEIEKELGYSIEIISEE